MSTTTIASIAEMVHELERTAVQSRAARHPFLAQIASGDLECESMAYIVKGYVSYSKRFPELISAAMSWWCDVAPVHEKLYRVFEEELSSPSDPLPHHAQLNRCADSFGVIFSADRLCQFEEICGDYATAIIERARSNMFVALGTIGPATEFIVPIIYEQIVKWFKHHADREYDYRFFEEHVTIDQQHGRLINEAIIEACHTARDVQMVRAGLEETIRDREMLWDRLKAAGQLFI